MRIFLAGASGVIGRRLVPALVAAGHDVMGMSRSESGAAIVTQLGGRAVVCDVFDREALANAVADFGPDLVMHQLTDLPDSYADLASSRAANGRIRVDGTRNLIDAAEAAGHPRLIAQSIAWQLPSGPGADAVVTLESSVLAYGGVVLRYGQFYGPGTYYETDPPEEPRVRIERAADRTLAALEAAGGTITVLD
jgi:nucleoside-diphosphate-sugar epimerase